MPNQPKGAIVGLGVTPMGKIYGRRSVDFAAEAIALALDDAGLDKSDLDGLLINANIPGDMDPRSQMILGFENLTLINVMSAVRIDRRQHDAVCLHGDRAGARERGRAGLRRCAADGDAVGGPVLRRPAPLSARRHDRICARAYGNFGANPEYAMAARRHMHLYGTTSEQFGTIAVGPARLGGLSPWAQMRSPITLEDHHNSRFIAEPLRLLDCCLVSNGAVARHRHLGANGRATCGSRRSTCSATRNARPATISAPTAIRGRDRREAFRRDRVRHGRHHRDDVDICQLYDCYTYTVLVTLEDYGFCEKGEGGPFVADGKLGPAARCRPTLAAASSPAITCGPLRRSPKRWCRRADRAASGRCQATTWCWSAPTAAS